MTTEAQIRAALEATTISTVGLKITFCPARSGKGAATVASFKAYLMDGKEAVSDDAWGRRAAHIMKLAGFKASTTGFACNGLVVLA